MLLCGGLCFPGGLRLDHGIESDDELAHDGDDNELGRLAFDGKPLGERAERVMLLSQDSQCPHIESGADIGPSTLAAGWFFGFPALAGEGGDPGQTGDLPAGRPAKLRQAGEERGCQDRPNAWGGAKQAGLLSERTVFADGRGDRPFDQTEFGFDPARFLAHQPFDEAISGLFKPDCQFAQIADEGSAIGDEFGQIGLGRFACGDEIVHTGCEAACDEAGIDAIGFGLLAQASGEAFDLQGIEKIDGEACLTEFADGPAFISARGFQGDGGALAGAKTFYEGFQACLGVRDLKRDGFGVEENIERGFGHVDAYKRFELCHNRDPWLVMRGRGP